MIMFEISVYNNYGLWVKFKVLSVSHDDNFIRLVGFEYKITINTLLKTIKLFGRVSDYHCILLGEVKIK